VLDFRLSFLHHNCLGKHWNVFNLEVCKKLLQDSVSVSKVRVYRSLFLACTACLGEGNRYLELHPGILSAHLSPHFSFILYCLDKTFFLNRNNSIVSISSILYVLVYVLILLPRPYSSVGKNIRLPIKGPWVWSLAWPHKLCGNLVMKWFLQPFTLFLLYYDSCQHLYVCALCTGYNLSINRMVEMTSYATTKRGKFCNVITHNDISANQKTESFVYRWLCALAMFDVTCFTAFVGASDIILK